jgi:outer membrane autotransporter protein
LVGSIGSEKSQFQGDNQSGQVAGSTAVGGIGLNYAYGPWELSGALDTAYGWYRSTRIVTVGDESGTADANPRQWQMGLHLHSGYSFALSNTLYAKPFVDGHAIRVTDDAFTEEGTSPFRLAVDGRTDTTWLGETGVEFGAHLPLNSGAELHPYVSAAAEFNRDQAWMTTAHFADVASGPDFNLATAGPGTLGRFVLGADLIHSDHLSFSLAYQPEVGRGYSAQGGTARFSYTF